MAIAKTVLFVLAGLVLGSRMVYSQAVLLFDNGSANACGGYEMTTSTVADDFELSFSAEATRGSFSIGDYTCTFPANWDGYLRWWIYTDSGVFPDSVVATGFAVDVSVDPYFDNCPHSFWYTVHFKLGQIVPLSSGVRYWLALHMAADWSVSRGIYWGTTSPGNFSTGVASFEGTAPWGTVGLEHAFSLELVGDDTYLFVDGFESGDTSIWSAAVP
jgi:hypothetical protein